MRFSFLRDILRYAKRKPWLFPVVVILLLFAVLLVLGESSALAPFIYTIF